jgi:hypothetical protein
MEKVCWVQIVYFVFLRAFCSKHFSNRDGDAHERMEVFM